MKKTNLRDGMILVTRKEGNGILLGNNILSVDEFNRAGQSLLSLDLLKDNLTHEKISGFDLIAVYEVIKSDKHYSLAQLIDKLPGDAVVRVWEGNKKEIDWSKVPKFTKVKVKYDEEDKWHNEYFLEFLGCFEGFKATVCNEFSYTKELDECYKICEIHPTVEIQEKWYKED